MRRMIDLPDTLWKELKIRAIQENKPLKQLIADILQGSFDVPMKLETPFTGVSSDESDQVVITHIEAKPVTQEVLDAWEQRGIVRRKVETLDPIAPGEKSFAQFRPAPKGGTRKR